MNLKLDSVLIGWVVAGVVIILAVASAIVGAANTRSGGFDLFLARLLPPLGVGLLIIAATAVLKGTLERRGVAGRAATGRAVEVARTAVPNQAGEAARAAALHGLGLLKVNLRLSAGNIGASVVSLFAVISVFIPWIAFAASDGRELETSGGFTFLEVASEAEVGVVKLFFFILVALGVVGLASVVLPRWAGLITGIVGMAMTLLTFIYIFVVVD